MKLCDLDEIKVCVDRQYKYCHGYTGVKKTIYREAILAVKSILHSTKPVDAVPVVRCRECKHCDPENYHCDHPMSTAAPLRRKPDDFCSYGERKECADGDCFIKCLHSEEVQYCPCKNDDYCSFGERRDSND